MEGGTEQRQQMELEERGGAEGRKATPGLHPHGGTLRVGKPKFPFSAGSRPLPFTLRLGVGHRDTLTWGHGVVLGGKCPRFHGRGATPSPAHIIIGV